MTLLIKWDLESETYCLRINAIWTTDEYLSTASLKIQQKLNKINKWIQVWGVEINAEKTVCIIKVLKRLLTTRHLKSVTTQLSWDLVWTKD